ncbi:MAG: hypothetical protein V3S98_09475 [Dehalococcoidia bacterium]
MELNVIYETKDAFEAGVAEQYRDLYAEKDGTGVWNLVGIVGIKTQTDIDNIKEALTKERDDHKATKTKLVPWEGLDAEEVKAKLDGYDVIKAKADAVDEDGKVDKDKLDEIANARVATAVAPLNRELEELRTNNGTLTEANETYAKQDTTRTISEAVRKAAIEAKVITGALDDVLLLGERVFEITEDGTVLTRDSVGVTPGIAPSIWLTEMQPNRGHWWPLSEGGGAQGSGSGTTFANNPWAKDHWNMTEQGKVIRESGREKADQMAKSAGTTVGAPKPVVPVAKVA